MANLTIYPTGGTGNGTISVSPNSINEDVIDILSTVRVGNGVKSEDIAVRQLFKPFIELVSGSNPVSSGGGTFVYDIYTEYPFKIVGASIGWYTIYNQWGQRMNMTEQWMPAASGGQMTIVIDETTYTGTRTANFNIEFDGEPNNHPIYPIYIEQEPAGQGEPYLRVSPSAVTAEWWGDTESIFVYSNPTAFSFTQTGEQVNAFEAGARILITPNDVNSGDTKKVTNFTVSNGQAPDVSFVYTQLRQPKFTRIDNNIIDGSGLINGSASVISDYAWFVSSKSDFVNLYPENSYISASGSAENPNPAGSGIYRIVCRQNNTFDDRDGFLEFKYIDLSGVARSANTIYFTQERIRGVEPSEQIITADSGGGVYSVTVSANTEWSARTGSAIASVNPTAGTSGITTMTITVPENDGELRFDTVSFYDGNVSYGTIMIMQAAAPEPEPDYISVSPTGLTFDFQSGISKSILVSSNASWTAVTGGTDVVALNPTVWTGNETITATTRTNNETSPKTETIVVRNSDGTASGQTIVTQKYKPYINNVAINYNLPATSGTGLFQIHSQYNWYLAPIPEWVTFTDSNNNPVDPSYAVTAPEMDGTVIVHFDANNTLSGRSWSFKLGATVGDIDIEVSSLFGPYTQAAAPYPTVVLTSGSTDVSYEGATLTYEITTNYRFKFSNLSLGTYVIRNAQGTQMSSYDWYPVESAGTIYIDVLPATTATARSENIIVEFETEPSHYQANISYTEQGIPVAQPYINLSPSAMTLDYNDQNTKSIDVITNIYEIYGEYPTLTVSADTNDFSYQTLGSYSVIFSAEDVNSGSTPRVTHFYISAGTQSDPDILSAVAEITQAGKPTGMTITPEDFLFDWDTQSYTPMTGTVLSPTPWTANTLSTTFSITPTTGNAGSTQITIRYIESYDSGGFYDDTIDLYNADDSAIVYCAKYSRPSLTADTNTVAAIGGTVSISVTSNYDWWIDGNTNYMSLWQSGDELAWPDEDNPFGGGAYNEPFQISFDANPGGTRTDTLYIKFKRLDDGSEGSSTGITITQS